MAWLCTCTCRIAHFASVAAPTRALARTDTDWAAGARPRTYPDLSQRCGKLGHFVDLAYSGCMVIKTQLPKTGSKFGPDEFRINSLCMSFYNHITTVR